MCAYVYSVYIRIWANISKIQYQVGCRLTLYATLTTYLSCTTTLKGCEEYNITPIT